MKSLYYRLFLKLTGLPSRAQLQEVINNYKEGSQIQETLELYISGEPIDVIALELDVTRERVRQYLLKAIR